MTADDRRRDRARCDLDVTGQVGWVRAKVCDLRPVIAGDDPTPWNLLRDGTIVRLERDVADTVTAWIDAPYVRARFPDGGSLFQLRLTACAELTYTPYDEPPITELAAIASSEPSLVEAKLDRGTIVVSVSAGALRVRYTSLVLELDTGTPVALEDLRRVVRDTDA